MIPEVLGTVGVGFISAFLPVVPAEPYLVGLVATTTTNPALLAVAAALGQSVGKLTIFLTARGTLRSPMLRHWLARKRALVARRGDSASQHPGRLRRMANRLVTVVSADRHRITGPLLLFVSAFTGVPPLIVMTFTAAAGKMRTAVFAATCLLGRTARMMVVALLPALAGLSLHL
ncbi:hypothetical protein [Micromonospora sp. DT227]|uniref:hypothetical protein n=1 Tax=Micromonospora sp. DT227 TaxID=3393433 RepID=UPI003CF1A962